MKVGSNTVTAENQVMSNGTGREVWEDEGVLRGMEDEAASLHNSFRTDTTGVSGLTMSSAYGGAIPLQPGEVAESMERPLSAPPPPGFPGLEAAEERNRKASEMILNPNGSRDEGDAAADKNANANRQGSSSFSNLAAVLGTGLAQSMEDATHERESAALDALNFHRQTRHAASRLIGQNTEGEQEQEPTQPENRKEAEWQAWGFPSSLSTPQKQAGNQTGADAMLDPDGMHTLLSSQAREFRPTPTAGEKTPGSNESSGSDNSADKSVGLTSRQAEAELRPFLWAADHNSPSRTIAILYVSYLRAPDVRSSCEKFGPLEGFRADFASSGIYFVSYYDIRSAQYAAQELQAILQRLSVMQRSSEDVVVRYCLPLNSSSQFDEGQIVISELPQNVNEHMLRSMMSSYGSIRSIVPQTIGAYLIEFHNTQDAKQAQLELESTQPFGPDVFIETAMRNQVVRKKGRELLSLIGRWRQGLSRRQPSQQTSVRQDTKSFSSTSSDPWRNSAQAGMQQQPIASSLMSAPTEVVGMGAAYGATAGGHHHTQHFNNNLLHPQETTQLVLGPDGRYTPVVVSSQVPFSSYAPPGATPIDPRQQHIIQGPNGQMYLAPVPASQSSMYGQPIQMHQPRGSGGFPATIVTNAPINDRRGQQPRAAFYNDAGSQSTRSHRSAYSTGTEGEKDNRHLLLDLDAVENGLDPRTSLMVRNIPNKYTQQMLLSEFEEHGHGPGIIDFFYLPIDFKNRCNRGYAFINFVDYRDILPFHQRYFGKHWRTFNSDKICDITYARIQGKAAMLKRFENSALMEKDDEYKPLVFASTGPEKGQRLPFPEPKSG